MQRVHFIAIGGSAMHNLAIALHKKGVQVTGSDDEIFEPSKSRLAKHGLLPESEGWHPEKISSELDAIILGMHARKDNPELLAAQQQGLKIYSYPEYLYEQARDKKRIVIAGSHGKTTITSMVMHVLRHQHIDFDYMVGAQLKGFETMVRITDEAQLMILEGDEYLSSPIDPRPKFLWYKPHVALISGIAWDHINVFPTWESYVEQFRKFVHTIQQGGHLAYFKNDPELVKLIPPQAGFQSYGYKTPEHEIRNGKTFLNTRSGEIELEIFGEHNLQNMEGARLVCNQVGIDDEDFYKAIRSFRGASRRLEKIASGKSFVAYKDFAHSPSKLKATLKAVREQYPDQKLIAVVELHTFSSLNKEFLKEYSNTMHAADLPIVYFNPHTVAHKKLDPVSKEDIRTAFARDNLTVMTDSAALIDKLKTENLNDTVLLLMTSGNFDGVDLDQLAEGLVPK